MESRLFEVLKRSTFFAEHVPVTLRGNLTALRVSAPSPKLGLQTDAEVASCLGSP